MSTEKQVAIKTSSQPPANYFPTDSDWNMMIDIGKKAVDSGMLPTGIKNANSAAIIALKARELNMPIMVGFAHIHVINGKPTLSAEMMQALARKNLPGLVINIIESSSEKAIVEFIRPEQGSRPYKLTFTIEDAKKADLLKNATWTKYPAAMLWSRAVSAGLRKVCPEALIGVSYTPEEMGANVDEEGNVIQTTGRRVEAPPSESPIKPIDQPKTKAQQITELLEELKISPEDAQKVLYDECKITTLLGASKEHADKFLNVLITEKRMREENEEKLALQGPLQMPWEKELEKL